MATTSLQAIRSKVRRITRSPSEAQLSTTQLDDYINTAVLYELPYELRLFPLRKPFTFYTQPNVDTYSTNTTDVNNALYDFKNKYVAVHPPVFFAGVEGLFTQQREVFYGYYPQTNWVQDTQNRGDGSPGPFTGTLTGFPVLQNNVIFTCLDTSGTGMTLVDYPVSNIIGALGKVNNTEDLSTFPYGQINYITGVYTVTFYNNTQTQAPVYSETIYYQPAYPRAMLYFNDTFTIRPVPDKVYAIQIEVEARPTELLDVDQSPELNQWWQYIAMLASRMIFEDRMDAESIALLMPMLKHQENLVVRTSAAQYVNERSVTIYTQGKIYGWGGWGAAGWPM